MKRQGWEPVITIRSILQRKKKTAKDIGQMLKRVITAWWWDYKMFEFSSFYVFQFLHFLQLTCTNRRERTRSERKGKGKERSSYSSIITTGIDQISQEMSILAFDHQIFSHCLYNSFRLTVGFELITNILTTRPFYWVRINLFLYWYIFSRDLLYTIQSENQESLKETYVKEVNYNNSLVVTTRWEGWVGRWG